MKDGDWDTTDDCKFIYASFEIEEFKTVQI